MRRFFILFFVKLLILTCPSLTYSQENPVSPIRAPDQSWEEALSQQMDLWGESVLTPEISLLQNITPNAIEGIPEWPMGLPALNTFVSQVRHARIYTNPNTGNYKRKAPWLYPIDGCYAKAAHISAQASARGLPRPGKIFAFGRLSYSTPYAPRGKVWWSYHVAAAYHVGSTIFVLDPTVNGRAALTVEQWLNAISANPSKVRVKLCDANAYSPSSRCRGSNGNGAYLGHIRYVLKREYNNLRNLGIAPSSVLAP